MLLLTASFILVNLFISSCCCAFGCQGTQEPTQPPHPPLPPHIQLKGTNSPVAGLKYPACCVFVPDLNWKSQDIPALVIAALLITACISAGKLDTNSSLILQSAFLANVAISCMFLASPNSIPLPLAAVIRLLIASI